MPDPKVITFIALIFQVLGALLLGLMSFRGLKIIESDNVFVNGRPVTNVTMSAGYVQIGRYGVLCTLIGIILSSSAALIS